MKKLPLKILMGMVFIHFVLFFNRETVSAQIVYQHTIGGNAGFEGSSSIVQTIDRGYVIAGETYSFGAGHSDLYAVKLDSNGNLQWTRVVGGSNDDNGWTIVQSTDGGYAIAGSTSSFGAGNSDVYIVKLDNNGNLQWTRTVGGSNHEHGKSLVQASDGGYVITGDTKSFGAGLEDIYIVKLDANGNSQWTRTVGGGNDDAGFSIIKTTDGGFAVAGYTKSFGAGDYDAYVVKLDNNGTLQWTRTVGGSGTEWGISIVQTTEGGYIIAGTTWTFGHSFYIFKLDNNGNLQWTRAVGGSDYEEGYTVIQTTGGGYAITG